MRAIVKGTEPKSLVEHRCQLSADYENFADKDSLREQLVKEQRGLCCYCMARITADSDRMKIEHWHSQSEFPHEQLIYGNLLAACRGVTQEAGNDCVSPTNQHCDTRKGIHCLSRNPASPAHRIEDDVHFDGEGWIRSMHGEFDRELNEVLNLNLNVLRENRREVLRAFTKTLGTRPLSRSRFQRLLADWNGDSDAGELRPYCQVVVYWLRKRLRRGAT